VSTEGGRYSDNRYSDISKWVVPSDSNIDLVEEFNNVKQWAEENKMILNLQKTKEIVFRWPNPRLDIYPDPITEVEQVFFC